MTEETVPALETMQPENMESIQDTTPQDDVQDAPSYENKPDVEDQQDRNWRETRKALKDLRKQNEELRLHLSQMNSKPQEIQEEESNPDDWITEKKLQKRLNEMELKMKAREAESVVDRLKLKFNDFDDVVSPENVEYLKENDPELAHSLSSLRDDPYQQGIAAYKLLKRTDYYMNREAMKDKKKIQENYSKPPSVNQVRKSGPLSEANKFDRGLTSELKTQLWKEMQEARKGA